jgi:alkanesulfonate monooxygenase SsuD/methylene tetrahydromethanopterin reductase-like flavin-dependent oxidoreductase (luciferase family)
LPPQHAAILDHVLQCSATGSPATVARGIAAFVERTGVDELMIASSIYDVDARMKSVALAADVMRDLMVAA